METATCDYRVLYNIYVPKGKRWHKILVFKDTDKYSDIMKSVGTLIATHNRFKVMVGRYPVLHFNGTYLSTMYCVDCYKAYKIDRCRDVRCCLVANICDERKYYTKNFDELRKECRL